MSMDLFAWILIALTFNFVRYGQCQCSASTRPLELNATGDPQYLTSPNYPENYNANDDCEWRISAPENHLIVLNVQSVRTESCSFDYMKIYDGVDSSSTQLAKLCSDTMDEVVSSTSDMFFTLTSDYAIQYEGFNILYFFVDTQYQHPCGTNPLSVNATPQTLMSDNLPNLYGDNVDCSWTLVVVGTNAVVIKIKFLDLETSAACTKDALTFFDGATTSDSQLSSLCSDAGTYEFSDIQSTGSTMLVTFTTDAAQYGYGFLLTYETNVTYVAQTTTTTTTTATTAVATLENKRNEPDVEEIVGGLLGGVAFVLGVCVTCMVVVICKRKKRRSVDVEASKKEEKIEARKTPVSEKRENMTSASAATALCIVSKDIKGTKCIQY